MPICPVHCQANWNPVSFGQHTALDAAFGAVSWIGSGFFPRLTALWSSPRPCSAIPNRCRSIHQSSRHLPATALETPRPQPIPEIGHALSIWRTTRSGSRLPTGSLSAGHRISRLRSVDLALADDLLQTDAYSDALAVFLPALPIIRLIYRSLWSFYCWAFAPVPVWSLFGSCLSVYLLFG